MRFRRGTLWLTRSPQRPRRATFSLRTCLAPHPFCLPLLQCCNIGMKASVLRNVVYMSCAASHLCVLVARSSRWFRNPNVTCQHSGRSIVAHGCVTLEVCLLFLSCTSHTFELMHCPKHTRKTPVITRTLDASHNLTLRVLQQVLVARYWRISRSWQQHW
jgi:hypothetical protein